MSYDPDQNPDMFKRLDDDVEAYCDARTWRQATSGSWGESHIGCLRRAFWLTPDGHQTCRQHAKRPPANGWN